MKLSFKDYFLFILSFVIAYLIFISQGPYDNWAKYCLPASPIVIVFFGVVILKLRQRLDEYRKINIAQKKEYDLMTAVHGKSQMHIRLLNPNGDIDYQRQYYLELTKNTPIDLSRIEHISTEAQIDQMPPEANVISSNPSPQELQPIEYTSVEEIISGREHLHHSWRYSFSNPLKKKGDYVEYSYSCTIPKSEKDAFTEQGGILFVECGGGAIYIEIKVSLVAPPGYQIKISNCYTIDSNGTERDLPTEMWPKLDGVSEILHWFPAYAHEIKYLCEYKCIKK